MNKEHPQITFENEVKNRHTVATANNNKRKASGNFLSGASSSSPLLIEFTPPPLPYRGSESSKAPDLDKFYLHPVLLIAPHLQFPGVSVPCGCRERCGMRGTLAPLGWGERRQIHGLHGVVAVLQYRYKCSACTKTVMAAEMLKSDECPEFVRLAYTSSMHLTKNGEVTDEVMKRWPQGEQAMTGSASHRPGPNGDKGSPKSPHSS